jgi:hypothetical protein
LKFILRSEGSGIFHFVQYVIFGRLHGTLTQHRSLAEAGAHCFPWNRCSIGICYEDGLDADGHPQDTRPPEQRERVYALLTHLRFFFPDAELRGHRDISGTAPKDCPCFDAAEEYRLV